MEYFWPLNEINSSLLGDNFVGIVYRITCSTEDGSRTKSLFLKIAPSDPIRRTMVPVGKCFVRESYMYEVVIEINFIKC